MNWLYPTPCIGCGITKKGRELFCIACGGYLELVSLEERCDRCFGLTPLDTCFPCQEKGDNWVKHRAYCIDQGGPWDLFIYTAPVITQAALLVYQYAQFRWDWPGAVFSTEPLFGREVAHFLRVPFRRWGPFYGEHILIVERKAKQDEEVYLPLLKKGALSVDIVSLESVTVTAPVCVTELYY
ncbi:MAG: hypothetical protein KBC64_04790 [Simkaniaceae bacterium]|nr:hypothetical protein [Simkaniaceae bacterium]